MIDLIKQKLGRLLGEGRGRFRIKRIIYTAISLLGSKGLALLVTIISLPLTYNYLGEERYGMMATIVSFLAMLGFADLGLGLGLHNRVSEFETNNDWHGLRKVVSSTFYMLVMMSLILFALFLLSYYFIDWSEVFNVHSPLAISEANPAMAVFILIFVISLPFSIAVSYTHLTLPTKA